MTARVFSNQRNTRGHRPRLQPRIFKFGERGTLDANFDIYNAFNSDAVLTETTTYSGVNGGAWLLPTSVIVGRIIKFGARWDF